MKRLLVTGARGFIGRHCLAPALQASFEVHAVASSAEVPADLQFKGVTWHAADLLAETAPAGLIERVKPTHLLHGAWVTAHGSYWTSPDNLRWLAAGTRLAAAFAAAGGRRFVSLGTCAEYDWTLADADFRETATAGQPPTFYGAIKLAHGAMLDAAARQCGFSTATGRIFFAYGPHENAARIIPYTCRQLAAGQPAEFSNGRQLRDFCYVTDVARGFVALLDSAIQGPCNVCSGEAVALADIVTTLGQMAGREDLIKLGVLPDRPGDAPRLVGGNDLLRSTGWKPAVALDAGLRLSLEWWRALR
jgi:nucleoside-diphosphate-sugar epimerase